MSVTAAVSDARWRRAFVVGLTMLVGSLLPSPLARHEAFDTYGPDKWLHFLGHGAFTVTLADAVAGEEVAPIPAAGAAVGGSVALALVVSALQQYVPGRVPELADTVAGTLGSVAGVGWWYRAVVED